ncbi:uncharacterized protein STEHIDRAFT_51165 [Stereum hirsutum FP-91666 SS1]|uniref:uncharacterized protein n=1 Tax=Stereum hirsutum (strain FP-91666) TaxID=721885 RepID=UPI000440D552|nr:uncharacterized protein STEHIDRAFT_51165 [Stereum hirsutum FP-91666 SS1]EIM90402.1 hypothetical protein STEHIDRAFT_51165 [Stereum hirsutum FP-91666 SS1]
MNQLTVVSFDIEKNKTDSTNVHTDIKSVDLPSAPKPPTAKPPTKPKKKVSKWILWQLWFNTYRKLFVFTVTLNMIGLGLAAGGVWQYGLRYNSGIALANINVAILVRNEIFGRLLYLFVNTFFAKWTPLRFRLACTSVLQHLGGIHSGCATSGIIWILLKVVRNFVAHNSQNDAILVFGVVTNLALVITAMAAFPWVRNNHHNAFERPHRFVGWTGIVLTWVFTILGDCWDEDTQSWDVSGKHIVRQQDFWFVMGMTIFTVTPWACTRHVKVDIELPSPKVAILRFERGMQQGLLARISRSAVKEYHAFGVISEGRHAKYHYLICGVQGDFTRSLVNDPPERIWTRELKFAGVSNTSTLYKRGIRICTGTGLGAALATCIQSPNWSILLPGSDQEKTFGPTISGLIHRHLEGRVLLWDSKQRGGRPDTMKILKEVWDSWQAEVVFITSNYQGNAEITQGCKEAGIHAFGTLWDFVSFSHLYRERLAINSFDYGTQ